MQIVKFFLVVLLVFPLCGYADSFSWKYVNQVDPSNFVLVKSDPNKISVNSHKEFEWYSCSSEEFLCLLSGVIAFTLPKDIAGEKQWQHNDVKYKALASSNVSILGTKYPDAILISANFPYPEKRIQTFLFSHESGLLAFSETTKQSSTLFILEASCGFGASENCKVSK